MFKAACPAIDIKNGVEAFTTLNMNVGVNFEPAGVKLFNTNPFAIAFKRSKPEGFVALGATDRLLRVTLDDAGLPTINPPAERDRPGQHHPDRVEGPAAKSSRRTRTTRLAARTRAAW